MLSALSSDPRARYTYTPEPEYTGIGDRPLSGGSDFPGDPDGETDSHRTELCAGFGDQSTYDTYAPEPDDAGDGDRPLSADSDRPRDTESHRTNFRPETGSPR